MPQITFKKIPGLPNGTAMLGPGDSLDLGAAFGVILWLNPDDAKTWREVQSRRWQNQGGNWKGQAEYGPQTR